MSEALAVNVMFRNTLLENRKRTREKAVQHGLFTSECNEKRAKRRQQSVETANSLFPSSLSANLPAFYHVLRLATSGQPSIVHLFTNEGRFFAFLKCS